MSAFSPPPNSSASPTLAWYKHLLGIALLLLCFSWLFPLAWFPLKPHKSLSPELLPRNQGRYALVFFGFPGCTQVCPTSLQALAHLYQQYPQARLDIVFVNLMSSLPPTVAQAYAQQIHPDFIVYPDSPAHLQSLIEAFGAQRQGSATEIWQHSGFIYLLEKVAEKWQIRDIYRDPPALLNAALTDLAQLRQIQK